MKQEREKWRQRTVESEVVKLEGNWRRGRREESADGPRKLEGKNSRAEAVMRKVRVRTLVQESEIHRKEKAASERNARTERTQQG